MQQKLTPARLLRTALLFTTFIVCIFYLLKKKKSALSSETLEEIREEFSEDFRVLDLEKGEVNFVWLELFTSDGCFDCPASEKALQAFLEEVKDENIIAVTPHVDYWDHLDYGDDECLGVWKDEHSSGANTSRQFSYARQLNVIPATPQVIFNGVEMMNDPRIEDLSRITDSLKNIRPVFNLSIALNEKETNLEERSLVVDFNLKKNLTESLKKSNFKAGQFQLFLLEKEAVSRPTLGENCGETLNHKNILRVYNSTTVRGVMKGSLAIEIPSDLDLENCQVVAIVQDLLTLEVLGASKGFGFERK